MPAPSRAPSPCSRLLRAAAALLVAAGLLHALPGPAQGAWDPPGVDLSRPRLLLGGADLAGIRERLEREPYRTLFERLLARAADADDVALDDDSIGAHRRKSRAAKNLAFAYALDRTLVAGEVVPFPSPAARRAVGDRVRELLLNLFPRSRIAVPPPLGDWDRDISTSEELLQYATAWDTLLGAGYDPGADGERIAERLTDLASELYLNYVEPETGLEFLSFHAAEVHQNNHRSKVGAALVAAGVALAERTPAPGADPLGIREPSDWIDYGLDQMDLVVRWVLTAGDGAYAEGPHYANFASLNLHPVLRAWDRLVGGRAWRARGLELPSLWRHPLYRRSQRWALDITLPDGSLPPLDDSFVGEAYLFGSAPRPEDPALAAAFAWRWANATEPFADSGNVDLAADAIVNHRDDLVPAPPPGSPTAFYLEGGNAVFRSDWSPEAVMALVSGEHDTASEFGRDRDGLGVAPQSHEHEEPGSFLLHAFGERLLLDPGMVEFSLSNGLGRPPAHNGILVDGEGPSSYLLASLEWLVDPASRPPADGHAILHGALDGAFLDAVSVVARYGQPAERAATLRRRFLFADDRYLLVADRASAPGPAREYTWLLHGNGGASSGGGFEETPAGARWSRPRARLDAGVDFAAAEPRVETAVAAHEATPRRRGEHVVLRASASGEAVQGLQLLYPTPAERPPPSLERLDAAGPAGAAGLALRDAAGDRRIAAAARGPGGDGSSPLRLPAAATGLRDAQSDGHLLLADARDDGALRLLWSEGATRVAYDGAERLRGATPGRLGLRVGEGVAELVLDNADAVVEVPALPFAPAAADAACALHRRGGRTFVELGRERRIALRAAPGNARPAADPGPERRVAVGSAVPLDAGASCDADGDALAARWELASAPPGSAWRLEEPEGPRPVLHADRPGTYRVRLVVEDERGAVSRPAELRVLAGEPCGDGVDGDLDGRIDADDPDCDVPPDPNRAPQASPDAYEVTADAPFEAASGVLADDTDPDGDALTAVVAEPPAHGELLLLGDGRFFYDPDAGFAGSDGFRYVARDAHGLESAPVRVTLEVRALDEAAIWILGGLRWLDAGVLVDGDLSVERGRAGRIRRVSGAGTLAGGDPERPASQLAMDLRRLLGPLFWGGLRLSGGGLPEGGVDTGPAFGWVAPRGEDGAAGWLVALRPSPPYLVYWRVRDRRPGDDALP